MLSIESMATFFGRCTVINIGFVLFVLLLTSVWDREEGLLVEAGAKVFGITTDDVKATHFRAFRQFRIAIVVLNLVPYIARA